MHSVPEPPHSAVSPKADQGSRTKINTIAAGICAGLGETHQGALNRVRFALRVYGVTAVEETLRLALEIEARGGMLTLRGDRRRTSGGVFFSLLKERFPQLTCEQGRSNGKKSRSDDRRGDSHCVEPQPPRFSASDEIIKAVASEDSEKGKAHTVKITLTGRPGRIVRAPGCVLTTMEAGRLPALPKGLPQPPDEPTTYHVYISDEQWAKLESALADRENVLRVEGVCVLDREHNSIAVLVQSATTERLRLSRTERRETNACPPRSPNSSQEPAKPEPRPSPPIRPSTAVGAGVMNHSEVIPAHRVHRVSKSARLSAALE